MYDLIYVDPETIIEEEYFTAGNFLLQTEIKMSTPGPLPKYWFVFSYIH